MRSLGPKLFAAFTVLAYPAVAWAGMPVVTLTDVARLRVQSISFFLFVFLLSSFAIQRIWNRLASDFPVLPRLSYGKALGVVTLWGLLFLLVLTMISGARELLTPGAWEKQGFTYKLTTEKELPATGRSISDTEQDRVRIRKLDDLRLALWDYARSHDGKLPKDRDDPQVSAERWQTPDISRMRYLYVAGQQPDKGTAVLAFEPELYGTERYVLFTNGDIRHLDREQFEKALEPKR